MSIALNPKSTFSGRDVLKKSTWYAEMALQPAPVARGSAQAIVK
jgi:hypothetical protein